MNENLTYMYNQLKQYENENFTITLENINNGILVLDFHDLKIELNENNDLYVYTRISLKTPYALYDTYNFNDIIFDEYHDNTFQCVFTLHNGFTYRVFYNNQRNSFLPQFIDNESCEIYDFSFEKYDYTFTECYETIINDINENK